MEEHLGSVCEVKVHASCAKLLVRLEWARKEILRTIFALAKHMWTVEGANNA